MVDGSTIHTTEIRKKPDNGLRNNQSLAALADARCPSFVNKSRSEISEVSFARSETSRASANYPYRCGMKICLPTTKHNPSRIPKVEVYVQFSATQRKGSNVTMQISSRQIWKKGS